MAVGFIASTVTPPPPPYGCGRERPSAFCFLRWCFCSFRNGNDSPGPPLFIFSYACVPGFYRHIIMYPVAARRKSEQRPDSWRTGASVSRTGAPWDVHGS